MLDKQYKDVQFEDQTICKNLAQLQKEYEYLSLELNEKTNFLDENEKKLAEL